MRTRTVAGAAYRTAKLALICGIGLSTSGCFLNALLARVIVSSIEDNVQTTLATMQASATVRLYRLSTAFDSSLVSYARQLDQEVAESEDGAEGPRAFREKRKPVWKMR